MESDPKSPISENGHLAGDSLPIPLSPQSPVFFHAIEQSPLAVVLTDPQTRIVYVNPHFELLTGYSAETLIGQTTNLFKSDCQPVHVYQELWAALKAGKTWHGDLQNRRSNGDLYWTSALISPLSDPEGNITHFLGLLEDRSERHTTEALFEHLASHDALTGLPNQLLFNDHLTAAINHARPLKQLLAVMLLNLDRFKVINETLGYDVGDQLIQLSAQRLSACVRASDLLARRGGGEFMLLLSGLTNFQGSLRLAQALLDVFNTPFQINGQELHLTASLGISLYPDDGDNPQSLLQNADAALYDAKDGGRNNFKFFKYRLNTAAHDRLALENDFRQALAQEDFRVFYQPLTSVKTGKICGMEALVRWQHPEHGLLSPDRFIPLAEETGLIVPLGKWVLTTACAQTRVWQNAGFPDLHVAVNLSGRQFQEPELVETVLHILEKTGLAPDHLHLELTETVLMRDVNITLMILRWLTKKGIRIAIDDFGTGYSSLMYLKRFPIDILKIDRSFVADSQTNSDSAALVTAIRFLARNLNLTVVAEGVETIEQLEFLAGLECDEIQGYLFSPPVCTDDFTKLLNSGRRLPLPV